MNLQVLEHDQDSIIAGIAHLLGKHCTKYHYGNEGKRHQHRHSYRQVAVQFFNAVQDHRALKDIVVDPHSAVSALAWIQEGSSSFRNYTYTSLCLALRFQNPRTFHERLEECRQTASKLIMPKQGEMKLDSAHENADNDLFMQCFFYVLKNYFGIHGTNHQDLL